MKKMSPKSKCQWDAISKSRDYKRLRRKRLKILRKKISEVVNAVRVVAPESMLLGRERSHKEVTGFLDELRKKLASGVGKILIDFTKTEMIYPGGGLLLYAELQRSIDLYPEVKFYCRESNSNRVNQVLQHLKIFKMLNYSSQLVPTRDDVVSWRHASANDINCEGAGQIIETYDSLSKPISKLFFKAAVEAITNAIVHAYDEPRNDGLKKQKNKNWWMFCREDDNHFYMSVCDLGVGIPRTLTTKNASELLSKVVENITLGKRPNDAHMILGAMEYARTRTQNPNQGKGMMDIRRIIESQGVGYVSIYSNKGCVKYDVQHGYQQFTYENSIRGTLIVWSFPLQKKADSDETDN